MRDRVRGASPTWGRREGRGRKKGRTVSSKEPRTRVSRREGLWTCPGRTPTVGDPTGSEEVDARLWVHRRPQHNPLV